MGATPVLGVAGQKADRWPGKTGKLRNEPNFLHAGFIFFPGNWVRFGQTKPFARAAFGFLCCGLAEFRVNPCWARLRSF
jgi:hypothetical protein